MLLKYQGNNYLKVVKATIQATKIKNPCKSMTYKGFCGEEGIRTPGTLQYASFQD